MNQNRSKIYIVNDSGHRYDLALREVPDAEMVSLTRGSVNPTQVDRLSFDLTQTISMSEKEDYLLLSGTPILNALAGMLWILRHDECRFLIFDAKEQAYVKMIVSRHNMQRMIDDALFA